MKTFQRTALAVIGATIVAAGAIAVLLPKTVSNSDVWATYKKNSDSTLVQVKRMNFGNQATKTSLLNSFLASRKIDSNAIANGDYSTPIPPTPPPPIYTKSAVIVAKTGQTISGLDITGGTTSCIIIPYGVHDVIIKGNKLHDAKTDNGCIFLQNGAYNITIKDNYIYNSGRGIYNVKGGANVVIVHNFISSIAALNIQSGGGSAIQFNSCNGAGQRCDSNMVYTPVSNSAVGDLLNFFKSSGTPSSYMSMKYNKVLNGSTDQGGKSAGVVGDVSGSYQDCEYNIAVNSGMEAWQVQGGSYIICSNNIAFGDGSNPVATAAYTYGNYGGIPTNNVTMANNKSNWLDKTKRVLDFWVDTRNGVTIPTGWNTNKHDATITINILPNPLFKIPN